MSSFFKNENYRIFNPSIAWILSDKINFEKLLVTIPDIFIPSQQITQPPLVNNSNNNNNNNGLPISNSNSYSQGLIRSNNNFKFVVSGSIRIYSDNLSPNNVARILYEYHDSKLNNVKLLFQILLKLETFFIKKQEPQFNLFKFILKDYKPIGDGPEHKLELFENLESIFEAHKSIYAKLSTILNDGSNANGLSLSSPINNEEVIDNLKKLYYDIIIIINTYIKDWKKAYSTSNRYLIMMNESIKENITAVKFYYYCVSHFWVFIDLVEDIYKILYQGGNMSADVIYFGDTTLKKLKNIKKSKNQSKLTGSYILKFSTGADSKYPLFEFLNDKLVIYYSSISKTSLNYGEFSIHYKYQFNQTEESDDDIPRKEGALKNIRNNKELLFIAKSLKQSFSFYSKQISNQDILNVFENILIEKDIYLKKCNICKFNCHSIRECKNCDQSVCLIDTAPNDPNECLNCFLLTPMPLEVRYFDQREEIPLRSTDFRMLCTSIYRQFKLPKGSLFQYQFTEKDQVKLENIYTLMLVKKELEEQKKSVILSITSKDPILNLPTIPNSAITVVPIEIRDGNKGGHGSIHKITVDKKFIDTSIPLVFKELKLTQIQPKTEAISADEAIELNNQAIERFRYEAYYIGELCKRSKYVVQIFGFCELPLGFILEEAPLGSINRRSFKSWELILLILIDICKGMKDIHSYGLIHRDLKPDNILLFTESIDYNDVRCKIADFGISTTIKKPHDLNHTGLQRTPTYSAPEFDKNGTYNELVDIYTFGLIVFNMLTGKKYLNNFGNPAVSLDSDEYKWFPKEIHKLISATTNEKPELRPSSFEAIFSDIYLMYTSKIFTKWNLELHPE